MDIPAWLFKAFILSVKLMTLLQIGYSMRILLLPHLSGSHLFQITTAGEELLRRSHDVFCVLPKNSRFTKTVQNKGITILTLDIDTMEGLNESPEIMDKINRFIFEKPGSIFDMVNIIGGPNERYCKLLLNDERLINQIRDVGFDIAIVDLWPFAPCLSLVPNILGIPFVGMSTGLLDWDMGVPYLPSFMSFPLQLASDKMTLSQKMESLFHMLINHSPLPSLILDYSMLYKFAPDIASWPALTKKAVLFIVLRDHILENPKPSMPNVVRVPGILYKPVAPLPTDLEGYIKATQHVIVVSFGASSDTIPKKYLDIFLRAFAQFPDYLFIWKIKDENNLNLPNNIIMLSWIPQNDLLGHNKTKLFISHCGNNGLHEALYHGVPVLGLPLAGDQPHNAYLVENRNYGLNLDILTTTSEQLVIAIQTILKNETIQEKVKRVSMILKVRKPPLEEIGDSIEHVLKYGDVHLRPASLDMSFYELYMLDIFWFLLMIVLSIILLCFILSKVVYMYWLSLTNTSKDKFE